MHSDLVVIRWTFIAEQGCIDTLARGEIDHQSSVPLRMASLAGNDLVSNERRPPVVRLDPGSTWAQP